MSSNRIRAVLMLGAGGIGMSALARYYLHQGLKVFGYDKTPTDLTNTLISEGAVIIFEDDEVQIQPWLLQFEEEEVLVVYTPAVPPDSKIYNYVINHSFKIIKRAEALGKITRNTINLSVAGTHGKTTTSCMLAHILKEVDAAAFSILGGISTNIGSNYYNPFESMEEQASFPSVVSVTEADEFDRSFLHLSPFMAAITNMDSDHLDVYGNGEALIESFLAFARRVDKKGVLFIHHSVQHHFMGVAMDADIITYGIENGQIMASNVHINKGRFVFDLILEGEIHRHMVMGMPGKHNIENALAAIAMANELDIDMSDIRQAIASYKGVKRRFEYRVNSDRVYIDDYAHHPTELNAIIGAVKQLYPTDEIVGIFQPHLFSRTRDFMEDFAKSLSALDRVVLLDIYPAREKPMEGVSSSVLLDHIDSTNKCILSKDDVVSYVENLKPRVLLTLGAGDIDQLCTPLQKIMST